MSKLSESLYPKIFPSIIVFASLALIAPIVVLWDGIRIKFISKGLVPYQVDPGDVDEFFFAYIDRGIVDGFVTFLFWVMLGIIGIFTAWVVVNTYIGITNILIIDSSYENKSEHYLAEVFVYVLVKAVVSLFALFAILFLLRTVATHAIASMGVNLFGEEVGFANILMVFLWYLVLVVVLQTAWVIGKYFYSFIRTPVG